MGKKGLTHVRESRSRQCHSSTAHQYTRHNQQVGVGLVQPLANIVHQRQDNQRRNGVADEGGNHQDQAGEDEQDAIQAEILHALGDHLGDGVQQTRRVDGLAERQAAGRQDDDGPGEVVEVLLGEDADAKEEDDGDDGDDAHVAELGLKLVRGAPQADGGDSDQSDEPLQASELVLDGADGHDGGALAWLEGEQQQGPDEKQRDDADGDDDEEPLAPGRRGLHQADGDDVLWGGDGREHATYVGGEGNAHDDGLGHVGPGWEVAEHRLDDAKAEDGSGDVADQHTSYGGHGHVGDENCPGLGSSLAEDEGCDPLVDAALGESGC